MLRHHATAFLLIATTVLGIGASSVHRHQWTEDSVSRNNRLPLFLLPFERNPFQNSSLEDLLKEPAVDTSKVLSAFANFGSKLGETTSGVVIDDSNSHNNNSSQPELLNTAESINVYSDTEFNQTNRANNLLDPSISISSDKEERYSYTNAAKKDELIDFDLQFEKFLNSSDYDYLYDYFYDSLNLSSSNSSGNQSTVQVNYKSKLTNDSTSSSNYNHDSSVTRLSQPSNTTETNDLIIFDKPLIPILSNHSLFVLNVDLSVTSESSTITEFVNIVSTTDNIVSVGANNIKLSKETTATSSTTPITHLELSALKLFPVIHSSNVSTSRFRYTTTSGLKSPVKIQNIQERRHISTDDSNSNRITPFDKLRQRSFFKSLKPSSKNLSLSRSNNLGQDEENLNKVPVSDLREKPHFSNILKTDNADRNISNRNESTMKGNYTTVKRVTVSTSFSSSATKEHKQSDKNKTSKMDSNLLSQLGSRPEGINPLGSNQLGSAPFGLHPLGQQPFGTAYSGHSNPTEFISSVIESPRESNHQRYHIQVKSQDGTITGDYVVVNSETGSVNGVRYDAVEGTDPNIVQDALLRFLILDPRLDPRTPRTSPSQLGTSA